MNKCKYCGFDLDKTNTCNNCGKNNVEKSEDLIKRTDNEDTDFNKHKEDEEQDLIK